MMSEKQKPYVIDQSKTVKSNLMASQQLFLNSLRKLQIILKFATSREKLVSKR